MSCRWFCNKKTSSASVWMRCKIKYKISPRFIQICHSQIQYIYEKTWPCMQAETSCPLYRYNVWSNKCTVTYGRTEVLKSMSILTGCIYVSDLLYHYVMYHDIVSYIYIYIICLSIYYHSIFSGGRPKHRNFDFFKSLQVSQPSPALLWGLRCSSAQRE